MKITCEPRDTGASEPTKLTLDEARKRLEPNWYKVGTVDDIAVGLSENSSQSPVTLQTCSYFYTFKA